MSKIDVSGIENYSEMSAEEKVAFFEAYELPEVQPTKADDKEIAKLKEALSRANSQTADYKRQLREKQSEAERAEAERNESYNSLKDENAVLKKEITVNRLEKLYLEAGYSAELASATAKAKVDGDEETVMKNQMAYISETRKKLESEALNKQPPLSVGNPPAGKPLTEEDRIAELAMKYAGL